MRFASSLVLATTLGACAVEAEGPSVDDERATESASLMVAGVDVQVPFPFSGKWINNRRTELPLGITFGALELPAGEALNPALAELGNLLFFDRRLSKGAAMACTTCHQPSQGYAVTTFSKGVGGNTLVRTTPPSMNRAFGVENNWLGERTLEQQSSAPFLDAKEMGLTTAQLLAATSSVPGYVDRFNRLVATGALSSPAISVTNIERALATFQRLTLMTGASRVDRYEAGDASALTPSEISGRFLFHTKARCVLCHSGSNYTDESFHHIVPVPSTDLGRQKVTGLASDFGKFKTPSLRNVALRGPYFHNGDPLPTRGMATTVEEVVRRYNAGPPTNERNEDPLIIPLGMNATEQANVAAFLRALTGSIPADPSLSTLGTSTSGVNRENIYLSPAIFNAAEYGSAYPDLAGMTSAQLQNHWLNVGMLEGRTGVKTFNVDEYLALYTVVHDRLKTSPNKRRLAFDDYLDVGRPSGRIGRAQLHRGFFNVQEYRELNGRTTALLSEEAAINHWLTTGQTSRLPAAMKPTGYFIVATATATKYFYADGASYCSFASAVAQQGSRGGRADDVGVPRLGFVPSNLQNGGACVTTSSPPTPSVAATLRSAKIVPFSCQASSSNAGCSKTVACPSGMTVRGTRAACNLEFGTVSASQLDATSWGALRVLRSSDVATQGHCRVDQIDIAIGSIRLMSRSAVPDRVTVGCSEHDENGGDCHILGELLCSQ